MESVKCKYFCFFIGLAVKGHILHTCGNPLKALAVFFLGFKSEWGIKAVTGSAACMWVLLIQGDTGPLLLGLRKHRDQVQLCIVPSATQSARRHWEEGQEEKSML